MLINKFEMKFNGNRYRGLLLVDSDMTVEEAAPLLMEERIRALEDSNRRLRENIRELYLVVGTLAGKREHPESGQVTAAVQAVAAVAGKLEERAKGQKKKGPGGQRLDYDEVAFAPVFRNWLDVYRKRVGNQDEPMGNFAKFLELAPSELSSFMGGKGQFGKVVLERMAAAFGVTPAAFLAGPVGDGSEANGVTAPDAEKAPEEAEDHAYRVNQIPVLKKKGEIALGPLEDAYCENCRGNSDGYCTGCKVASALKMAARQDTPGLITVGAKQAACAGCRDYKNNGGGICSECRLGAFWAAKGMYDTGAVMADAITVAEADYQLAIAK